jgi:hypothetical protein
MLLFSSCGQQPSYPEPPKFNLDHFKAYNITIIEAKKPPGVTVKDQFMYNAEQLDPKKIKYLILPVNKKVDEERYKGELPIPKSQNHLSWYRVKGDNSRVEFEFRNQFTNFKFTKMVVKKLRALLVPTEKIKKYSKFPENLDHYLCYQRVEGERTTKQVILSDQFQQNVKTTAIGPEYFCNPCSKNGKEIKNSEDHLAVYVLGKGKSAEESVSIDNQFGKQSIVVKDQIFLLVPSKKNILCQRNEKSWVGSLGPGLPSSVDPA